MPKTRKAHCLHWLALLCATLAGALPARAAETIKSYPALLSGTMGSARRRSKDVALMTIEEINAKGRRAGKEAGAGGRGPASNWPLFAEKARSS